MKLKERLQSKWPVRIAPRCTFSVESMAARIDQFQPIRQRRQSSCARTPCRSRRSGVFAATDSLVLAATNHVEILDQALARRFDEVIEYTLPDVAAAREIIERRLGKFKIASKSWMTLEPALEGLSQGELVRAANAVVKDAILEGATKASAEALRDALHNRQTLKGKFRRQSGR